MSGAYFAYGSNMSSARIRARVGACPALGVAWLERFELRFHKLGRDGSGKCDVHHTGCPGHRVHGALFHLDAWQQARLDEFEGTGYERRRLHVGHPEGTRTAWVYVARSTHVAARLRPFDWYKALVVNGAREHGLPRVYVDALESVRAMPDPDTDRVRHNRCILDGAEAENT